VLAIPPKRFDRTLITYLTEPEVDALLGACDQQTWTGRRDHALLLLAVQPQLPTGKAPRPLLDRSDPGVELGHHAQPLGQLLDQRAGLSPDVRTRRAPRRAGRRVLHELAPEVRPARAS
jgi:integrase/recombinase XerD